MAKPKLLQDKILNTEEQSLSSDDLQLLTNLRNKQLTRLATWYVPLALILLYVVIDGIAVIQRERPITGRSELSDEEKATFHQVVPYVCGAMFLMLTGYFINMYLQGPARFIKDIKNKKKLQLCYVPEKSEMSVFHRYYISSPVVERRNVELSEDAFYSIPDGETIIIEIAKYSYTVLRFTARGKEIRVT